MKQMIGAESGSEDEDADWEEGDGGEGGRGGKAGKSEKGVKEKERRGAIGGGQGVGNYHSNG